MPSLSTQIYTLNASLADYKPESPVEGQVGKIANVLIAKAKEAKPDDAVVQAVEELEVGPKYVHGVHVGTLRAILAQLQAAVEGDGPLIA
jgi:hypothetical protein